MKIKSIAIILVVFSILTFISGGIVNAFSTVTADKPSYVAEQFIYVERVFEYDRGETIPDQVYVSESGYNGTHYAGNIDRKETLGITAAGRYRVRYAGYIELTGYPY